MALKLMTGTPTYHAFLEFLIKDAGAMLVLKNIVHDNTNRTINRHAGQSTEKSVILVEYSVKIFLVYML